MSKGGYYETCSDYADGFVLIPIPIGGLLVSAGRSVFLDIMAWIDGESS